jgi:hypothetical protein
MDRIEDFLIFPPIHVLLGGKIMLILISFDPFPYVKVSSSYYNTIFWWIASTLKSINIYIKYLSVKIMGKIHKWIKLNQLQTNYKWYAFELNCKFDKTLKIWCENISIYEEICHNLVLKSLFIKLFFIYSFMLYLID